MATLFLIPAMLCYVCGVWLTVTTTYRLSKQYKDWRGFPAVALYVLSPLSWIAYVDILYVRLLVYLLENFIDLLTAAEGPAFVLADNPRPWVESTLTKYTKTEKVNAVALVVDFLKEVIKKILGL